MSGYTKLFSSILQSTIWCESSDTRVVWITMLAMADRDGVVEGSVPGLARTAGVDRDDAEAALASFLAPDRDSRTKEHEGRRIEVIDGGWRILNYEKYRERASKEDAAEKHAARQRRYDERQRQKAAATVSPDADMTGPDAPCRPVTPPDPIAEAPSSSDLKKNRARDPDPGPTPSLELWANPDLRWVCVQRLWADRGESLTGSAWCVEMASGNDRTAFVAVAAYCWGQAKNDSLRAERIALDAITAFGGDASQRDWGHRLSWLADNVALYAQGKTPPRKGEAPRAAKPAGPPHPLDAQIAATRTALERATNAGDTERGAELRTEWDRLIDERRRTRSAP